MGAVATISESRTKAPTMKQSSSVETKPGDMYLVPGDPEHRQTSSNCSAQDLKFLDELRAGQPQPFFANMTECAVFHSISLFFTWIQSDFVHCMQAKQFEALSRKCLACYSSNAEYAFNNCRTDCLSWCSPTCLR